jgi:hypothetical protein
MLAIHHWFGRGADGKPLKLNFNEEDYEEDEDLVSGKQEDILCDWLLVERFKYVRLLI